MTDPKIIEAVAREITPYLHDQLTEYARRQAPIAAIAAHVAALDAAGWLIVPKEPTERMLMAGANSANRFFSDDGPGGSGHAYRAMLAAAPRPE